MFYTLIYGGLDWIKKLLLRDTCQKQNTIKISMVLETNYIARKTTQIY